MENNTVGKKNLRSGIVFSGLSAFLSGMYIPLSKLMLNYLPTRLQGGIAYMSAGLFALLIFMIRILDKRCKPEEKPKGKEWLAIACIAIVDCFALFFFYQGFDTTSSNVSSLIAVTELLLTALLATIFLKEKQGLLMWIGIVLVASAIGVLAIDSDMSGGDDFSWLWILAAYFCWAVENNISTKISAKDPFSITGVKCLSSGLLLMLLGTFKGERTTAVNFIFIDILIGMVAVSISISFFILGERYLGAGKAAAIYSANPIVGLLLGFIIFRIIPNWPFYLSLFLMMGGLTLAISQILKEEREAEKAEKESKLKSQTPSQNDTLHFKD